MKNKYGLLKVLIVLLAVVIAGVIYSCVSRGHADEPGITDKGGEVLLEEESRTEPEETSGSLVCVHVCGSVKEPGVYYLPEDSRVHQAVEMAGGFTEDAAESCINLADIVTDGEQIYIPSLEEAENGGYPEDAGKVPDREADGLVNINTAGIRELTTLTGIGESKAEAIIAYRENVSPFGSTEDIINVSGIGESIYEKIKDSIKVK